MLQENEVVTLIMGIGVLLFIILNKVHVKKINSWRILVWGYYTLLSGWVFTVLEGFILENYLNLLEHISYAVSTILFAVWCWKSAYKVREEELQ
jgi:hypothetical protein